MEHDEYKLIPFFLRSSSVFNDESFVNLFTLSMLSAPDTRISFPTGRSFKYSPIVLPCGSTLLKISFVIKSRNCVVNTFSICWENSRVCFNDLTNFIFLYVFSSNRISIQSFLQSMKTTFMS